MSSPPFKLSRKQPPISAGQSAGLLIIAGLVLVGGWIGPPEIKVRLQSFVLLGVSLFLEAFPFLLIGSVAAGFIGNVLDRDLITRLSNLSTAAQLLVGLLLGVVLPVGETGSVVVTRRLLQGGVTWPVAISFLIAAPVINPLAVLAVVSTFGLGPSAAGRLLVIMMIAAGLGFLSRRRFTVRDLKTGVQTGFPIIQENDASGRPAKATLRSAVHAAADNLFEFGGYLVIGAFLAAALQTIMADFTGAWGDGSGALGVVKAGGLAVLLSVETLTDVALITPPVGNLAAASTVTFLTLGAVIDIKRAVLLQAVFKRRFLALLFIFSSAAVFAFGGLVYWAADLLGWINLG